MVVDDCLMMVFVDSEQGRTCVSILVEQSACMSICVHCDSWIITSPNASRTMLFDNFLHHLHCVVMNECACACARPPRLCCVLLCESFRECDSVNLVVYLSCCSWLRLVQLLSDFNELDWSGHKRL